MTLLKKAYLLIQLLLLSYSPLVCSQQVVDYVNPFIGTSNFGATYPGPVYPRGMVSVSPFNVAGKQNLPLEKDSRWLSNPYVHENTYLTGFSQVNLSGVGCPDLGSILLMPTTGALNTDHKTYGSNYSNEVAKAGYYTAKLDKYQIKAEMTSTKRVGINKYSFPKGQSNILLNLGLGLTNEEGASIRVVSPTEIEGVKNVGSFCYYNPESAYPVYFVAQFSKAADEFGVWSKPKKHQGVEAQWMGYNGKLRLMPNSSKLVIGDSIGAYVTYRFKKPQSVTVKVGVSYVSIENARENLQKEAANHSFKQLYQNNRGAWNSLLSKVQVEGGTQDQNTVFYTALYHSLIHPNILNDSNGDYPAMETREVKNAENRYTVFSLWDTYRNYHQLMTLLYPDQQSDMVKSMLSIYDESGWLPKWELNATETNTMVGDPAAIVIADTYRKGIRDFDVEKAYKAILKNALTVEGNPIRRGNETYLDKGYLNTDHHGSVSITQEYNIADYAISLLAKELGHQKDYRHFKKQSIGYRNLFDPNLNLLHPRTNSDQFYEPFNPDSGANFEANIGFIEGNSWQYSLMCTHDLKGMVKLMGGKKTFLNQLQHIFDSNRFDMANEPDIAYPYLFNYFEGEQWRTQDKVNELIETYFNNRPDGLPGNDDTGTMSAWLVFSMMGIYPVVPGDDIYAITDPVFDRIQIQLDSNYYPSSELVIEKKALSTKKHIESIYLDGKQLNTFFVRHKDLVKASSLRITH